MTEEFICVNTLIYAIVPLYDFQGTCDVYSNTIRKVLLWALYENVFSDVTMNRQLTSSD